MYPFLILLWFLKLLLSDLQLIPTSIRKCNLCPNCCSHSCCKCHDNYAFKNFHNASHNALCIATSSNMYVSLDSITTSLDIRKSKCGEPNGSKKVRWKQLKNQKLKTMKSMEDQKLAKRLDGKSN